MPTRTKPTYDHLGIAVIQPDCNGWKISYNPDDSRWYVYHPTDDGIVKNYADRRNALQFARSHNI